MTVKEDDRTERMRRVRVGLTGLAAVLIIVMLATAVLTGLMPARAPAPNSASAGDEPLADMGVAPGAPDNAMANQAGAPR